ncbi:MAG: DUF4384 domain-containing protein [Pyrinomonadaceae bacterium]
MKTLLIGLAFVCFGGALFAMPQDQDEQVRGAFLTSRPKEKTEGAPTGRIGRRRPKPVPSPTPKHTRPPKPNSTPTPRPDSQRKVVNTARLGLGLTLFLRDSNGLAVRVDPGHVFGKGDRVRLLLETNTDGYLYIFNTTDNGAPMMIYPDPQLDEAGNYLQAHVPFEIPSSTGESEERLRWFTFDENAGTERLYFVFTREQLPGIPIEDDLVSHCKDAKPPCPLRPDAQLWAEIDKQTNDRLQMDRPGRNGRALSEAERDATTRGLGLSQDDPPPGLILMASSASTSRLVTSLDLIHK